MFKKTTKKIIKLKINKMKNIVFVLAVLFMSLAATAQKKNEVKPKDCYLTTASTKFNLSNDHKGKLEAAFIVNHKESRAIGKKIKAKEISKEDAKKQRKEVKQEYLTTFASLTGSSKKELAAFDKETRKKCKK
jgi:hypothetical protein